MRSKSHDNNAEKWQQIIQEIRSLKTFGELSPQKFAVIEDGTAHKIAKISKNIKTNQMRKFFTKIKSLENKYKIQSGKEEDSQMSADFYNEISLLNYELAYSEARGLISKDFLNLMHVILKDKIKTYKDFKNFVHFMTAIIAYAKYEKKD